MKVVLLVFLTVILFSDCFADDPKVDGFYRNVIAIARESVGLKSVPSVGNMNFNSDCIGFVRYVYYKAGFDLVKAFGNGRGGVSALYDGLYKRKFTYAAQTASPGDLIFFDNTYDINKDGLWNDPLSHIGIVAGIGKHNTIYYIHFASGGVDEDKLNLYYPNTHAFKQKDGNEFIINSYLRRNRGEGFEKKMYVASFFYRAFAHIRFKVK
jgi:probable lipoprotein NlpC